MIKENTQFSPEDIIKEMFWLAYQACGGTAGMGFLQARSNVSKEDVWNNVNTAGDYIGPSHAEKNEYYGDYVFGRMMKLSVWVSGPSGIELNDMEPRADYQAWSRKYKSYEALYEAAVKSLQETTQEKSA